MGKPFQQLALEMIGGFGRVAGLVELEFREYNMVRIGWDRTRARQL
jgi:hypothetical protein